MAALRSLAEELELAPWERRLVYRELDRLESRWLFYRTEDRTNVLPERYLDCGHTIGASEPYRYVVGKLSGADSLYQRRDCDVCKRRDARY